MLKNRKVFLNGCMILSCSARIRRSLQVHAAEGLQGRSPCSDSNSLLIGDGLKQKMPRLGYNRRQNIVYECRLSISIWQIQEHIGRKFVADKVGPIFVSPTERRPWRQRLRTAGTKSRLYLISVSRRAQYHQQYRRAGGTSPESVPRTGILPSNASKS